tara:strand:- start:628 stop:1272 length:645 start_codon:yes stop_codon:yes gene_type:complete
MKEKPSYYAIIPAEVRYAKELTPNAKLLYAEITALAQKDGSCWASNKYFSELYNVSTVTISRWISSLVNNSFIIRKIVYKKGTKEIDKRYLQLCSEGINNNDKTPINKIVKDNNTSINNTSINNISNRRNDFVFEVLSFDYEESILNGFIDYWTEPNKSKSKMKFELEKTWETKRRLKTWAANQKKWDKPKSNKKTMSKLDAQINEWQKAKELL